MLITLSRHLSNGNNTNKLGGKMEQRFWDKLKRVKISDLLHIFMLVAAFPISLFVRLFRRNIWLICDTRYEAGDNGFWLFKYIRENEKEVDVIFALDKKSKDYDKVKKLGKVVQYGSFMHWVYYLAASKNVSSQKMGKPNAAICYVLEVYGLLKNKRAFLQHGIITANLTFLHYANTKMKLFVTSTQDEWKYVNDEYGYPEGCVQKLGLCRFDALHNDKEVKKQILIMPTWRMYIRNVMKSKDSQERLNQFKSTTYFKCWEQLIKDKEFLSFIEREDIEVVFYPHREMINFIEGFEINHPRIRVETWENADVQSKLIESAILITDYSSVSMDFAYMKKPLIYYQFDKEEFRSKHHPKGYFTFEEDGFGPVCETAKDVVSHLMGYYQNGGFVNKEIYNQRHEKYFDLYDSNNCKRNFEAISRM